MVLIIFTLLCAVLPCAATAEDNAWDDVAEETGMEPLGPDDEKNLARFEQGLPTGLRYENLLADEDRKIWSDSWQLIDGVLYDTRFHALLWYTNEKTDMVYEVLPGTLYIAADALGPNPYLQEIILPEGLKVIGRQALCGFIGIDAGSVIRRVRVPASVELIASPVGSCVYSMGCSHPCFEIEEGNARYKNEGPLLIDAVRCEVLFCADGGTPFEVNVPEGIRSIAPYAFSGAYHCVRVNLPEGLESIGDYAFSCCYDLMAVNIPSTVIHVGEEAFSYMGETYGGFSGDELERIENLGFELPPEDPVITIAAGAIEFEEEQYPNYAVFMRGE